MGKAVLSDGKKSVVFPLVPETVNEKIAGDFAANPILDKVNPSVRRKSSNVTVSLSRCLFISQGLNVDYYGIINTLQFWAREQTRLKFSYNKTFLPFCYIKSMSIDIKQYRNGKPVHVEIDIELIASSEETKEKAKVPAKKITPREQEKKVKAIKGKLKNPAKKVALGLMGNFDVSVSELAMVTITNEGVDREYELEEIESKLV